MLAKVSSRAIVGVDALEVQVEVDVATGLPSFDIVGLPGAAVREARDRVRSAIRNSGFQFPLGRVTVNLAPAHVPKSGTLFDLPIAMGILMASGQLPPGLLQGSPVVVGELSLDGAVRSVRGVLSVAASLRDARAPLVIPRGNRGEVEVVAGVRVVPVGSLREAVQAAAGQWPAVELTRGVQAAPAAEGGDPWRDVWGQEEAKRALEICIAGGHHALLIGPPGAGKTLLARQASLLAPPLSPAEIVEVSRIYSVAGLLSESSPFVHRRPFRSPHHTVTAQALLGGGTLPRPGEVSLAHRGFLFLDEFGEFDREAIESLREPLEEGEVTISRLSGRCSFPARFTLIAALNPCPCGYLGDARRPCTCRPAEIDRYRRRLSGPILDRIDLFIRVDRPDLTEARLGRERAAVLGPDRAGAIARARGVQAARLGEGRLNGEIPFDLVHRYCDVDRDGERILRDAAAKWSLSPRSIHRVMRVARTIADLRGEVETRPEHVLEALSYRRESRLG